MLGRSQVWKTGIHLAAESLNFQSSSLLSLPTVTLMVVNSSYNSSMFMLSLLIILSFSTTSCTSEKTISVFSDFELMISLCLTIHTAKCGTNGVPYWFKTKHHISLFISFLTCRTTSGYRHRGQCKIANKDTTLQSRTEKCLGHCVGSWLSCVVDSTPRIAVDKWWSLMGTTALSWSEPGQFWRSPSWCGRFPRFRLGAD